MPSKTSSGIVIIFIILVITTLCCAAESYTNPPRKLQLTDLVGVWEVHYSKTRIDQLTIRTDGLYKQVYQNTETGYLYETDWDPVS
jgi:hypothetical protein